MENKNLTCPGCGCDDLHYVSVTKSEQIKSRAIQNIFTVSWFIFSISIAFLIVAFFNVGEIETLFSAVFFTSILLPTIIISFCVVISTLIILSLTPYKVYSEIEFVCPHCGMHGNIDGFNKTETENTNQEQQTNENQ